MAADKRYAYTTLQQRVWRWHFFAGLMVVPFAIILSLSGALYLFKPQVHHFIEERIHARNGLTERPAAPALPEDQLLELVLQQHPNAQLKKVILEKTNDPTLEFELSIGGETQVIWVNRYSGEILHQVAKSERLMETVRQLHGELLAGDRGSYVVELMASWMVVLIVTGVFLWWPRARERRGGGAAKRALAPSLASTSGRGFWYRLHGATGLWLAGFILLLLLSGLPWTQVWGGVFKTLQTKLYGNEPDQQWNITLQSKTPAPKSDGIDLWRIDGDDEVTVTLESKAPVNASGAAITLADIATKARASDLPPPVIILPPRGDNGVWTVRSMTQNRPQRITYHYDRWSGEPIMTVTFADQHALKKVVGYGLALHEGALFGPLNQALGLITALGIILLSAGGTYMWWQRRPHGKLAAPRAPAHSLSTGAWAAVALLAAFLPLVALSLVLMLVVEFGIGLARRMRVRESVSG